MTQNGDKEEDLILIIIETLCALVKPENRKSVFGQEPNIIFYESQVFHCYRFVTNDTDLVQLSLTSYNLLAALVFEVIKEEFIF